MSVDLHQLHPVAREAVELAVRRGWSATTLSCGKGGRDTGVLLVSRSHPAVQLRVFPVRQWNERKLNSLINKINTYGGSDG